MVQVQIEYQPLNGEEMNFELNEFEDNLNIQTESGEMVFIRRKPISELEFNEKYELFVQLIKSFIY